MPHLVAISPKAEYAPPKYTASPIWRTPCTKVNVAANKIKVEVTRT